MKTKTFFFICLFLGIGFAQLSAQNSQNSNGTDTFFWEWDIDNEYGPYAVQIPVKCDNNVIDWLAGKVTVHQINHYLSGELIWVKQHFEGEVIGALTDEVFKVKDISKCDNISLNIGIGHVNLVGNKGSHYRLLYTYNGNTNEIIFITAICN